LAINANQLIQGDRYILGDSAYPLSDWCITPYRDNGFLTPQQRGFNRALSSARQCVERGIGHLKGRCRRLREIPLHKPGEMCSLITAGCIVHNLCILNEDHIDQYIDNNANDHPNNYPPLDRRNIGNAGARRQILTQLF
jgi:hypothetical protein